MEAIYEIQRVLHQGVTTLIASFAETHSWSGLFVILPLGLVFGAVHPLTPGHSKIVLASYVLGSRLPAGRSAFVAVTLAVTHISSAVVLALLAAPFMSKAIGSAGRTPSLELLSRGLLLAIGAWLIVRALRRRPHVQGEGAVVGVVAGLIPCPLTLFAMVFALSKGVVVAGLAFAVAMMLGVMLTLIAVASGTAYARDSALLLVDRHGASIESASRGLDFVSGLLLIALGISAAFGTL